MVNNADKERWIEEVLNSTRGMSRAQPGDDLLEKIHSKINNYREAKTIPFPVKQWVAAAILLVLLNAGSVVWFTANSKKAINTDNVNPLASEMQLESTYNY